MPKDSATAAKSFRHAGIERDAGGGLELDPHEELAGLPVVELLALDHVRIVIDEEARDGPNQTGPVGARHLSTYSVPGTSAVAAMMRMLLPD